MKKIGYLRVSTSEQKPDRQIDGLKDICDEMHIEKRSANASHRPVFDRVIAKLKPGDMLVVWDLDRAFRSVIDAIVTAEKLRERGVEFRIVTLSVDTATPSGMLLYTVMAAAAQFERGNLAKRTKEGMAAARARGVRLGRPPKLSPEQVADAQCRISAGLDTSATIAEKHAVSVWTVERALSRVERQSV